MKNFSFKSLLPHLVAVIIFIIVAAVYCKPALQGKVVSQHDHLSWRAMAQQSFEFKEKHGNFPLWTNSMFSGMPAYQIAMDSRTHISVGYFHYLMTLGLPKPISFFFLACITFYFLCIVAGANPWLGILGGLAYAYSTFDPIIIAVGHDTQMYSLGYAPAVIGGLLLLLKKKYWAGFAITSLFSALLIMQNHVQIVYYTLIIALLLYIAYFIKSYREKQAGSLFKPAILGLIAGVLGLACSAVSMVPTYDYSKESMRGGRSELTLGDTTVKTKGGLKKDYAFNYSLGFGETLSFMVPALYGGSNGGREFSGDTKFVQQFSALGVPGDQALQYENSYAYWGEQPFTSGPVYLGAIVCLLFIFFMVYVKGWYKWWLAGASLIGLLLAFGHNLSTLNYFLFDYLPFYNKFRAPTMALVIPQFCFPLAGVLALQNLIRRQEGKAFLLKKLKLTGMIAGGLVVFLGLFYMMASFSGPNDQRLKENFKSGMLQAPPGQQVPPEAEMRAEQVSSQLISALVSDRKSHMGGDLFRTTILMALALGLLYLFAQEKISKKILFGGLILLTGFDLLGIATRYLGEANYVEEANFESAFNPSPADLQILQDPDHNHFRVFNQTTDSYNDAITSYHFNSVGGYHPAKLDLYNDLITWQLSKGNMEVFDMLNTKYFIVPNPQTGQPMAQQNPDAFGNAWLVKDIKFVADANEEMLALDHTDLRDTAVVENKFKKDIGKLSGVDSTASIKLGNYLNDEISYDYKSSVPQVAVFSEIYYPRGWEAFIDGKRSPYFKADYVLRAMYVPAGEHKIEFKFDPKSYTTGRMIAIIGSLLVFLILIGAIIFYVLKKKKPEADI